MNRFIILNGPFFGKLFLTLSTKEELKHSPHNCEIFFPDDSRYVRFPGQFLLNCNFIEDNDKIVKQPKITYSISNDNYSDFLSFFKYKK